MTIAEPTPSNQTCAEIDRDLLRALYFASELLRMLRRLHCDPQQSSPIQADIIAIAQWIGLLIEQREEIVIETTEQIPDLVRLTARLVCQTCRRSAKDLRKSTIPHENSAPPPIWRTQLDFLLSRMNVVGMRIFASGCAEFNLREFPDCLTKLRNALLRMRRYLRRMGTAETKIQVEHSSHNCAVCGRTIEPDSEPAP